MNARDLGLCLVASFPRRTEASSSGQAGDRMHVDSSKCLQNGLLKRQAPAFQKNGLWTIQWRRMESLSVPNFSAHPYFHFLCGVSWYEHLHRLIVTVFWCNRKSQSTVGMACSIRPQWFSISPLVTPGALWLCPLFSLYDVPRDPSFTLKCLSFVL